MKLAILASSVLMSASVWAHNSCDVELNAHVDIDQDVVEFTKDKQPLYKIVDDKYLFVEDEAVSLNSQQQLLVTQYSKDIKALVPEVSAVMSEGVDLALDGVNMAFNELLGEGNDVGAELTTELTFVKEELAKRMSLAQGISIGEDGITGDEYFDTEFESKIESVIEEAIEKSIGNILIAVGREMLFSGGDPEAFETRMESFGEQIEAEMELRAEALEQKAEIMCLSIEKVDKQEEVLRKEIEQLESFDVITVDARRANKA